MNNKEDRATRKVVIDPGHPRFYKPSVVMSCSK